MTSMSNVFRTIYTSALMLSILAAIGITFLLTSKISIFNRAVEVSNSIPFPVGVNPHTKTIVENTTVDQFFRNTLANTPASKNNLMNKVAAGLSNQDWYQNLASPTSRIIVIWPGERKEEIIKHIGDILRWDKAERSELEKLVDMSSPTLEEGKYFPSQYVTHRDATPAEIHTLISNAFIAEIMLRYTPEVNAQVPLKDAIIIASLLEREASDFDNMREISGIIWNRLFINMPLQLDATLQYVKGSQTYEPKWWPKVIPADKYLDSAYNTYQNKGLPPAPIANPAPEAILAALNPVKTACLFYFHTKDGTFYCSETYEGHVAKLRKIYGRGS